MGERYFSWELWDDVAIKHVDTSVVRHHGSGVPIQTRKFWDLNDIGNGGKKNIILEVNGQEHKAFIEMREGRTRIFWKVDFREACGLNRYMFSPDNILKQIGIKFQKIGPDRYNAEMIKLERNAINYLQDVVEDLSCYTEGKKKVYYTTKYERNVKCREDAIRLHGCKCMVCGFDFKAAYGELGEKYIEVHHKNPLYNLNDEVEINPDTDLATVCSNCHRMLHRRKDRIITIDELRQIVKYNQN
ncbi:HNH endonuclease [Diplocloster modestus]|nr:HNH endonuclease [Diplocloster modestus]